MKEKTYTVTVSGIRHNTYRITAKGARKAKEAAEKQFYSELGQYIHFDSITSSAVADWVVKEKQNEN